MANNIIKKVSVNGMEYENDDPNNYLDIYTTEERKIGTWFGEDLYRKSYVLNGLTNQGSLDVTNCNCSIPVKMSIWMEAPNYYINIASNQKSDRLIGYRKSDNNIYWNCESADFVPRYLVFEYTKNS